VRSLVRTISERGSRPSVNNVIYADQDGDTYLTVDQPGVLFASHNNPAITEVGNFLDQVLAGYLGD
jgi:hypothetical protein